MATSIKVQSSQLLEVTREKYHDEKEKEKHTKIGQSTHPRDLQLIGNKTQLRNTSQNWRTDHLTPKWNKLNIIISLKESP